MLCDLMVTELINIDELKTHEDNPRIIDTYKFNSLLESLTDMPQMLEARPIVVDSENRVIAGNMRYLACKELGWDKVPVKKVNLSADKLKEIMIKDNLSYGDWDYKVLEEQFDMNLFDKWLGNQSVDYSLLDDYEDLESKVSDMYDGVRKAIQIVFNDDNFELGKSLEGECRKQNIYIGSLFLEELRKTKSKYE